ncbi:MAG: hypothetical protein ABIK15_14640 [Pseudomonadota bacterium]
MFFHVKRYCYGLLKYRSWLWLVLFPPLIFLFVSAISPNQFSIRQDIRVSKNVPVALMTSPVGYMTIQELLSHPEILFQNKLSIRALYGQLYTDIDYYRTDPQFRALFLAVKDHMRLVLQDNNKIQIAYQGPEKEKGLMLVAFYSDRLIQNISEGIRRSKTQEHSTAQIAGVVKIQEERIIFEKSRMWHLFRIAVMSIIGVMILCGFLEYRDSSFKSERQMARYLEVPILGSIPDLNKVYASMEK